MIASPHNESNSLRNGHTADFSAMGQLKGPLHGGRGGKGDTVRHGKVGHTALSGQDRAVCHKGNQLFLLQNPADFILIFRQMHGRLHLPGIQPGVEEAVLHTAGEKFKENFVQLSGIDGTPKGRESHMETDDQAVSGDAAGAALQHRLSAAADGQKAALPRALRPEIILFKLLCHLPCQVILKGNTGAVPLVVCGRKFRQRMGNLHMEAGGSRKGIPLHMIDHQGIPVKFPGSRQRLIGRVAFMVDRTQQRPQFCLCFHFCFSPFPS